MQEDVECIQFFDAISKEYKIGYVEIYYEDSYLVSVVDSENSSLFYRVDKNTLTVIV